MTDKFLARDSTFNERQEVKLAPTIRPPIQKQPIARLQIGRRSQSGSISGAQPTAD
jgi:hypothetical protein